MNRWQNYGLWASVAAFIPIVLKGFGYDILPANYEEICTALLGILVLAGIISNPTTEGRGYGDDSRE